MSACQLFALRGFNRVWLLLKTSQDSHYQPNIWCVILQLPIWCSNIMTSIWYCYSIQQARIPEFTYYQTQTDLGSGSYYLLRYDNTPLKITTFCNVHSLNKDIHYYWLPFFKTNYYWLPFFKTKQLQLHCYLLKVGKELYSCLSQWH